MGFRRASLLCASALLLILFCEPQLALAQTQCPPGFVWQRMSGVGCVQENCPSIANARYSYTSTCICNDGYKGCYEPVDYAGFDKQLCGPFCPYSTLVACVDSASACPGEEPAPGAPVEPEPTEEPQSSPSDSDAASVDDLLRDLEEFLAGEGVEAPTAGAAAAGAAATSALLTAWVLTQLLSGSRPQDVIKALAAWREKQRVAAPPLEQAPASPPRRAEQSIVPGRDQSLKTDLDPRSRAPAREPEVAPARPAKIEQRESPTRAPERAEEEARRRVATAEDYVDALEKTRKDFDAALEKVPAGLKDSEFWKNTVKPRLDEVSESTDPEKIRKVIDELKRILDPKIRTSWDESLRHVPAERREGGVQLERALRALGDAGAAAHKRAIVDRAKQMVQVLPPDQARAAEQVLDRHQKEVEQVAEGVSTLPRTAAERFQGGEQMNRQLDQIKEGDPETYRELQDVRNVPVRPQDRPDFGKGWRKSEPARRWISNQYESFRSWLDRNGPIYFRRSRLDDE